MLFKLSSNNRAQSFQYYSKYKNCAKSCYEQLVFTAAHSIISINNNNRQTVNMFFANKNFLLGEIFNDKSFHQLSKTIHSWSVTKNLFRESKIKENENKYNSQHFHLQRKQPDQVEFCHSYQHTRCQTHVLEAVERRHAVLWDRPSTVLSVLLCPHN